MRDQDRLERGVDLLKALAAPVRLGIVEELVGGGRCVHELVDLLQVSQPLVSQHLRVLRGAGLVRQVRRGREVEYLLADEHVVHVVRDVLQHAGEADPYPSGPPEHDPHHVPHEERA